MASIKQNGSKWRVLVYVKSVRNSGTFATRKEAATWALEREAELRGAKLPFKAFGDAMKRYAKEVAPLREGERCEVLSS